MQMNTVQVNHLVFFTLIQVSVKLQNQRLLHPWPIHLFHEKHI